MKMLSRLLFAFALLCGSAAALADGISNPPAGQTFWPNTEVNTAGDSISAKGMVYTPGTPYASITGDVSNTSTTVANVSCVTVCNGVLMQVGQQIFGTGITDGTTISTITTGTCPAGCSITLSAAATGGTTGEALTVPSAIANAYQVGLQQVSVLGWMEAFTGNAYNWTPGTASYGLNSAGIYNVGPTIGGGGTGYSSPTFSPGAPSASPSIQAGNVSCATSGGVIVSCTPPNPPGAGYTTGVSFSCLTGCGSGASLYYTLGGQGSFGMPGSQTAQILANVPYICARHPYEIFLNGGTNDIGNVADATIISNEQKAAQKLVGCGVRVVLDKISARSTWTGSSVSSQAHLEQVNRGYELIGRQAYLTNGYSPAITVVDWNRYWQDAGNSSNPGYDISGMTSDHLHPAIGGAMFAAIATLQATGLPSPGLNTSTYFGQDDFYDGTNCFHCNLLGTKGLFLGTSGTNSTSCSGTVPTGWTLSKISGTSTISCGAAVESPRTDALSGQREVFTLTSATSGGSTENYEYLATTGTSNLSVGDQLYASCELEVSNYVNVNLLGLQFSVDTTDNHTKQTAFALDGTATAGSNIPAYTQVATLPLQGILPGFVQGASGGNFKLYLTTINSPLTIRTVTSEQLKIDIGWDASVANTQVILKMANCAVRKL